MQNIICKVRGCSFHSEHNFCLNRLTVINEQGVCNRLTKPGWDAPVFEFQKSTWEKSAELAEKMIETSENQVQDGLPHE